MKTNVIMIIMAFILNNLGLSQTIPKGANRWKKVVPEVKMSKLDTTIKRIKWSQSINVIDIPNVLNGKKTSGINRPIVILIDENLASMQDKENLDTWGRRNSHKYAKDSIPKILEYNKKERGKN